MRTVICGIGTVGSELASRLAAMRQDVTVIDPRREVCDEIYERHGVLAVCGDPTQLEVLQEAEVAKADLLLAASPLDAQNLAVALLAKSLGVPQIIVRLHNKAYEAAYRIIDVTAMVPVTDLTVNHLLMEIMHPRVSNITSIGSGKAEIFMLTIRPDAWVVGRSVRDAAAHARFPAECVFVAVYNPTTDTCVIPRGNYVFSANDQVYLVGLSHQIEQAVDSLHAT